MTREEFFTALSNGAKWDVGVSIARTNPLPLDANSVFETLEALTDYARNNPLAYPGQICSVITETEVSAYQLVSTGSEAVIHKLAASSSTTGNIEDDVAQLQTTLDNILNGTTFVPKAASDSQGSLIHETYAKKADFDTAKSKLDTVAENAQVNVLEGVKLNGTDLAIVAKKVNIDLSNYATKSEVSSIPKFRIEVVSELPTSNISSATIYLLSHSHATGDTYDEYIYTNGAWEKIGNTDIDLTAYSTTDQMTAAINAAIQALDITPVNVGVGETIKSVSQTDGKVAVTKQSIQIGTSQVTGLDTVLAGKADATDLADLQTAVGDDDTTGLRKRIKDVEDSNKTKQTEAQVNALIQAATIGGAKVSGAVAEASKVTNKLTVGAKEFDGSAAVEITASDLGALTEITKATADSIGGVLVGFVENGNDKPVKLDENGHAYVTVPAPLVYSAGDGLALTNGTFAIKSNGILTAMIKDGQVTDAKIVSVNANKLIQTAGDVLVLAGGTASDD